jgi:hypothetical protein
MKVIRYEWEQEEKKAMVEHVGNGIIVDSEKQMYRWMCMAKIL